MGNEEIRINGIGTNNAALRPGLEQSYDLVRGREEAPSIWENFSPGSLALYAAFPILFNHKEFKSVQLDKTLTGNAARANSYRMIRANELAVYADKLKAKNAFMNADLISLKEDIRRAQNSGKLAKAQLAELNKKYFKLLDQSTSWKTSFIQKGLAKGAVKSPSILGELAKVHKGNKLMILFELLQEGTSVYQAFQQGTDTGMKQLAKSTGRAAVGYGGFVAGMAAGGKIGALLGSVIPGAGTVVGGIIGSVIGFAIGGFTSQLAKSGYDKIIPSEDNIAKENRIEKMLSSTDTSNEAKETLQNEIALYYQYLNEAGPILNSLEKSEEDSDRESAAHLRSQMMIVYNTLNELDKIYKQKFGESLISQATTNTDTAATATSTAATTAQSQTAAPQTVYNSPAAMTMQPSPLISAYNPTGFVGNEFMNYTPQQDWSAMLPGNVSNRLFMTA